MGIQSDLTGLSTLEGTLTSNKVSRLAYTQDAYDNNDADGVTVYDVNQDQNIPTSSPSIMKVNETVVDRGFRAQGSSIPRMFLNHFLGRMSYNLNKVNDIMASLLSSFSSNLGVANGIATLDASGRIPYSQLPESAVEYKGGWNASTNTPTLADGTGTNGDMYIVTTGGTQDLGSGNITFFSNDRVIYNGSVWQRFSAGDVRSVAGLTPDPTTGNIAITGGASTIMSSDLTADKALVSDVNGKVSASSVSSTELGYLSGATSNVQNQLNDKMDFSSNGYVALKKGIPTEYTYHYYQNSEGYSEIIKDVVYAYGYYYVTTGAGDTVNTSKAHVYKINRDYFVTGGNHELPSPIFTTDARMCIPKIIYAEALDMLVIAVISGVSTYESSAGVWYSTDEGVTWTQSSLTNSISQLEYVENYNESTHNIFIAGATGDPNFTWVTRNAWYTEDITGAWTAIRTDSVFSKGINCIKVDPNKKYAYLGYQPHSSSVIGISWFKLSDKTTGRFTGASGANGQTVMSMDINPSGRYMFLGTWNKGYFWSVKYPDEYFNALSLPSSLGSVAIYNCKFLDESTVFYTLGNSNATRFINMSKNPEQTYTFNLQGEKLQYSVNLNVSCLNYNSFLVYNGNFYWFVNNKEVVCAPIEYLTSQTTSNNDYKGFTLNCDSHSSPESVTWESNMIKGINDLLFISSVFNGGGAIRLPSSETNWIDVMKTLAENENGVLVPPDTQTFS